MHAVPFQYDEKFHSTTLKAIKKELAPRILDAAVELLKPVQAGISVEIDEISPGRDMPDQRIVDAAASSGVDLIAMGARGIKGVASVFLGSVTRLVTIKSPRPVLVVKPGVKKNSEKINILFAADGSDSSRAAGDFLCSIPFPDDIEVTILNVISSGFSDIPERFVLEVNERIKDSVADARAAEYAESQHILEEAGEALKKRFKNVQTLSKMGDPSQEILKTGEETRADLIALGDRGLRGIRGFLGSVSRNILTHSKCSVFIGKTGRD